MLQGPRTLQPQQSSLGASFFVDLPRAQSDVFEAGAGPNGADSQERPVEAVSLPTPCWSTKKNAILTPPPQLECHASQELLSYGVWSLEEFRYLSHGKHFFTFGILMGRVGRGGP